MVQFGSPFLSLLSSICVFVLILFSLHFEQGQQGKKQVQYFIFSRSNLDIHIWVLFFWLVFCATPIGC